MNYSELSNKLNEELNKLQGQVGLSVDFVDIGDLFEFNSDDKFWAASVIKLHISGTVYKQIEDRVLDNKKRYAIDEVNRVDGSGISKLFDKDTLFTLHDLIVMSIAISDNSTANQLTEIVGADSIEEFIQEIGLKNTSFKHKMMIKAGKGPNLITARDATLFLKKLYNKELPGSEKILEIMKHTKLRNRIPDRIPNDVEVAHKPGSLPRAMHEVGIVYSKRPFIFSFFSDDQEDKKLTNEVLSKCAKLCFDYSIS
ncbi:serine hydrolase [Patescibacteria group bacterium]